jgi:hypothetical protein
MDSRQPYPLGLPIKQHRSFPGFGRCFNSFDF